MTHGLLTGLNDSLNQRPPLVSRAGRGSRGQWALDYSCVSKVAVVRRRGRERGLVITGVGLLVAACTGSQSGSQPAGVSATSSSSARVASETPGTSRLAVSASTARITESQPPSSPPRRPCTTESVLRTWSLTRLAEQVVVVPAEETDVASVTAEAAAGAGGVILFGSRAPSDLSSSLSRLARVEPNGLAPLVMTDEEGGAVQRLANRLGSIPSARQMGATMSAGQIEQLALHAARRMRLAGITMDLAPVLDLDAGAGPNNADAIGTRSFSTDRKITSTDGLAFAAGLRAGGVIPVVKHFPGLGGATGNTDVEPASTRPWSRIQAADLLPYQAAIHAGIPAIMVTNARVPGLTTLPASISSTVITGVLRGRLGFSGLVVTDSLSAGALQSAGYSVPRAAVAAVRAGADMVLYSAASAAVAALTSQTVSAIVSAVRRGDISLDRLLDAAGHVVGAKRVDLCH